MLILKFNKCQHRDRSGRAHFNSKSSSLGAISHSRPLSSYISLFISISSSFRLRSKWLESFHTSFFRCESHSFSEWKWENSLNEILVITPQILLDGIQYSFLKLDLVDLLIFYEWHHACGHLIVHCKTLKKGARVYIWFLNWCLEALRTTIPSWCGKII